MKTALRLLCLAFSACLGLSAVAQQPTAAAAPKPLFRDPVHDGAADAALIWNQHQKQWWMFYTNRRADQATGDPHDVAWVHATRLGIATSSNHGLTWSYKGVAEIPYGDATYTHWAPDVERWHGRYHMFLTIVPGTFKDWTAPRFIIHLTSKDLEHWKFESKLELGSDRVIDPCLFQLADGAWRIWYKDERDHSHIHTADSRDLKHWTLKGTAISDRSGEGPKVFHWRDAYWMITDVWKGLGVYRSMDLVHWIPQADNILRTPGTLPTDRSEGHHCDVVLANGRAFIFYFTHQMGADLDPKLAHSHERTVLQVAELQDKDGVLMVDRDQPVAVDLGEGK
jgi:hypothetical protein